MNILLLNNVDHYGGSGTVARTLARGLRERGHGAWLAVGQKWGNDPEILAIAARQPSVAASRLLAWAGLRQKPFVRLGSLLDGPWACFKRYLGAEDFDFPETYSLLDRAPQLPDVLHAHCVCGEYFDLRALPWLSHRVPTVLTLHDAALLGGGCSHSFDCEKWKTGCGSCPQRAHLGRRPDATHWNWKRKNSIYRRTRLFLAAPSRWMIEKAKASILNQAALEARVITTGVDLATFRPGSQAKARADLGIPSDSLVLLFVANGMRRNPYKDYATLRASATIVSGQLQRRLILLALGEEGPTESENNLTVRFIPATRDPRRIALHYQAADLYVHSARAETFPTAILEALACGRPVVASDVGGVPEQVKGLRAAVGHQWQDSNVHSADGATGILVPPRDPLAMAAAIGYLLQRGREDVVEQLSVNARRDAESRFDFERGVDQYVGWYHEIVAGWRSDSAGATNWGTTR